MLGVGSHFLEKLLVKLELMVKAFKVLEVKVLETQLKFTLLFGLMKLIALVWWLRLRLPKVQVMA